MNKTVFVPARFKAVGKTVTVKVPTGEIKKGLFGPKEETKKEKRWEQTGYSDCEIDAERLAHDTDVMVSSLNKDGYEVVAIQQILSGSYNYAWQQQKGGTNHGGSGYGYGYGYSYTEGVIIIARKMVSA